MSNEGDITALDASALSHAIRSRALSCREVMQAYLARIHRVNPRFNAIVNLARDEDLLQQADSRAANGAAGCTACRKRSRTPGTRSAFPPPTAARC